MKNIILFIALFANITLFAQAPANDKFENAVELSVSPTLKPIQRVKGTTKYATFTNSFSAKCLSNASQDVWYKFVATRTILTMP